MLGNTGKNIHCLLSQIFIRAEEAAKAAKLRGCFTDTGVSLQTNGSPGRGCANRKN